MTSLGARDRVRGMLARPIAAAVAELEGVRPVDQPLEAQLEEELGALVQSDRPVIVGPWTSEVGFEVLYWVPLVRWIATRFELEPSRLVALSRGGTASWYAGLCEHYVDTYELFTADEYHALTAARWAELGGQKQTARRWWDEEILGRFRDRRGLETEHVLHPSLMYRLFRHCWVGRAPIQTVFDHTIHRRFRSPGRRELRSQLPEGEYVAVKFYFRSSFPDTPANRRLVTSVVSGLANELPVVLLNTGHVVDDHADFDPGSGAEVLHGLNGVDVETNLHAQTLAIAGASAFVGTYGGLTYLANALGVPAIGIWSDQDALVPSHLEVGRRAADSLGVQLSEVASDTLEAFLAGAALATGKDSRRSSPIGQRPSVARRKSTGHARPPSPRLRRRVLVQLAGSERARRTVRRILDGLDIDDPLVGGAATTQTARNRATAKRVDRTLRAVFDEQHEQVVLGCWDGDVRSEVLYWLPFLRWAVEHYGVDPSRVLAVSRGGVAAWYRDVARSHADSLGSGDGLPRSPACSARQLTPDLLRELFADYWRGAVPVRRVLLYSRFGRLAQPNHAVLESIAEPFVAVDLDSAECLPDTPANRKVVRALVARLAGTQAVVLIGREQAPRELAGDILAPLDGLGEDDVSARSALIAAARAVIGAAGSESIALGACHGVPSVGLYSETSGIDAADAEMLFRTAAALGATSSLCHVTQLPVVERLASGRLARQSRASGG